MKCELCHENEAVTVVHRSTRDDCQELFVCQACAQSERRQPFAPAMSIPSPNLDLSTGDTKKAFTGIPMADMILDATFEIVGRDSFQKECVCSTCGISRDEYRKRSRLGCPACYESFAKEIGGAIEDLQRAMCHTGKAPGKAEWLRTRQNLLAALDEAITAQRFEEAIVIRDQLSVLARTCQACSEKEG